MLHISYQRARRGYTLTELMIVLGVASLIMAAIWTAAGNVSNVQKNNDAVSELQTVVQNILTMRQGQPFGVAVSTDITLGLMTSGIVPNTYVNAASPASTPWSGSTLKIWANPTAANARRFRVTFYKVTLPGCIALLLQGTACQANQSGCPVDVFTNATVASAITPAVGTGWSTAMDVATATNLCGSNTYPGTTTTNTVEFDYSL